MQIQAVKLVSNKKSYIVSSQMRKEQLFTQKNTNNIVNSNSISTSNTLLSANYKYPVSYKGKNINSHRFINNRLQRIQMYEKKIADIAVDSSAVKRNRIGLYINDEGSLFNGYTVSTKKYQDGSTKKVYCKYKNGQQKNQFMVYYDNKGKLKEFWLSSSKNGNIIATNRQYNMYLKEWDKDRNKVLNMQTTDSNPKIAKDDVINLTNDLLKSLNYSAEF